MKFLHIVFAALFLAISGPGISQTPVFNNAFKDIVHDNQWNINKIAQDKQGYIWLATMTGLQRWDGMELKTFQNNPLDSNSLAANLLSSLCIDSSNIIWIATLQHGIDRYDPSTNTFTHFRNNIKNPSSLSNDSITNIMADHLGNIWVSTLSDVDILNKTNGKFSHLKTADITNVKNASFGNLYEDKHGNIWIVTTIYQNGSFINNSLNKLDPATGKYTHFTHDPANPHSIASGMVSSLFEDSKGNFWIGFYTNGSKNGLDLMDRNTSTFTHYYNDSFHQGHPAAPLCDTCFYEHVTFISEDKAGMLWFGSFWNGVNRYDPVSKKITHYGPIKILKNQSEKKDSVDGNLNDNGISAFSSKDNIFWIGTAKGDLYNINPLKTSIPFYSLNGISCNTFYYDEKSKALWIGTDAGLIRKAPGNEPLKIWKHDPLNKNSLSNDTISEIRVDHEGNFWMITNKGLSKFNPVNNSFTNYYHHTNDTTGLRDNNIMGVYVDRNDDIWICEQGLDKLNSKTGVFTNYVHNDQDPGSIDIYLVYCAIEGTDNDMWAGTWLGLNHLNKTTGKFTHYLQYLPVKTLYLDHAGILWVGSKGGLFYYNKAKDKFPLYTDPNSGSVIKQVLSITEDKNDNLWVGTNSSIIMINKDRDQLIKYDSTNGVHKCDFFLADNYKAGNGELYFGNQKGYYAFFPEQLKDRNVPPIVNLTGFSLGDEEMKPSSNGILKEPLWETKEIKLSYNQNVFSIDFGAVNFTTTGGETYSYKLENYDNAWRIINKNHKAYFFNVPPGTYIFHAKAVNVDGIWGEKKIMIIITPPWWQTWWAYTLFALTFIILIWGIIYYRSRKLSKENKILEEKVTHRTSQLNKSLDDLKSAQAQLIQSEKMASLGELTAGIAHEIQNPLNFVNNFSEVNKEMLEELKAERLKPNAERDDSLQDELINDVIENSEKINHHGKRADAIVKGMLEHSRSRQVIKEPTDINELADEYLRLSYHGLRAKDKSFNAEDENRF